MKKLYLSLCGLMMLSLVVLAQGPQPAPNPEPARAGAKSAAPRSDSEIQKCIQGKLANSEKLRVQEFNVTVSNSEATFTGVAKNAGSKGAATRIGQSCGAAKVINQITAPAIPRPPKKTESKSGS